MVAVGRHDDATSEGLWSAPNHHQQPLRLKTGRKLKEPPLRAPHACNAHLCIYPLTPGGRSFCSVGRASAPSTPVSREVATRRPTRCRSVHARRGSRASGMYIIL